MPQSKSGTGSEPQPVSLQDAQTTLANAMKALDAAYKAANTMDIKDQIYAAMAALQEENDAVTQQIIEGNTGSYKTLTEHFKASGDALKKVQDNINNWINYVNIAAQVVNAIGKVLPLIASI